MNKYEMAVVFKPNLEEETHNAEIERVHALITRFGGTIEKLDDWGKRRLAYEINKCTEGFYSFITFNAESSAPVEIENRMRIMENVLRYIIIRVEA